MGRKLHIVVVPLPAQGHVKPLLQLSHRLVDHGIKVTFVNTEFIHAKVTAGISEKEIEGSRIKLASVPDGLEMDEDRNDPIKFLETFKRVLPGNLINLIEEINDSGDEPVTGVVADGTIGWILDVAKSIGLEGIAFIPVSMAAMCLLSNISYLIQDGIIDTNGAAIKEEEVRVSKGIPSWKSNELPWCFPTDIVLTQKALFELCVAMKEASEKADWVLCNTLYELEQSACNLYPKILPVGPLHVNLEDKHSATNGSFWQEDTSCLNWLSRQKPGTVIYVSFGSFAGMSQPQFNEVALGLQQSGQPFLWIVRTDIIYGFPPEYPDGFLEGVADRGMIVKWAPQAKVLSHPALACFISHCGWNSTLEGLSAGVPFLCWPFLADQFHNRNYICDALKVGLTLKPDNKTGLVSSDEISIMIEKLLSDGSIQQNATKIKSLMQKSFSKEGSSFKNMEKFINLFKA